MSLAVDELTHTIKGKKALAIEAYSRALRAIPTIIADNGGYDAPDLVQALKVDISEGNIESGLDMENGTVGNMKKLGIYECLRSK